MEANSQEIDTSVLTEFNEQSPDMDLIDESDDLIESEQDSKESRTPKRASMLHESECVVSHCTVKYENEKIAKQNNELRRKNSELTRENESLNHAVTNNLVGEELERLQIKSIQAPLVQSLKNQNLAFSQDSKIQKKKIVELQKKINELEQEQKDYMTSYELDNKYCIKKKQLKQMEDNVDLLLNREKELQVKLHSVEIKHDKLIACYNEKVHDLEIIDSKIKDSKRVSKRNFKPGKEKGSKFDEHKKRNIFQRIIQFFK